MGLMSNRALVALFIGAWLLAPAHSALAQPSAPRSAPAGHITIDVVRADVRDVLRLLAEVGGVNLVVGEEVSGTLTLKLKDVHWRDALRTVLRLEGLEADEGDGIMLVASIGTFQRERTAEVSRRDHCLATAPLRTRIVRLSYANAAEMLPHVKAELSPRGQVSVDARTNSLIVRDVDCPR